MASAISAVLSGWPHGRFGRFRAPRGYCEGGRVGHSQIGSWMHCTFWYAALRNSLLNLTRVRALSSLNHAILPQGHVRREQMVFLRDQGDPILPATASWKILMHTVKAGPVEVGQWPLLCASFPGGFIYWLR